MLRVIKDAATGQLYSVDDEQAITVEQAQEALALAQAKARELEGVLAAPTVEEPAASAQEGAPMPATEEPTPAEPAQPETLPEAPQEAPAPVEAPAAPEPVVLS